GEGVGGGAGKAADHVALADPANLLGVGLDHGLADRDLPVAADHHLAALADGADRGAMPDRQLVLGCLHRLPLSGADLGGLQEGYNRPIWRGISVTIGRSWALLASSRSSEGDISLLKDRRFRHGKAQSSCARQPSSARPRRPTSR
ncbi:hypothetical protein NS44R_14670, partial [Mammaliicoccus sciuri]